MLKSIWEGWRFLGRTKVVRGIVIGMTGAFAAGGAVVGLGPSYITNILAGGSAGWGAAFAAIFFGLAIGMSLGLPALRGFSRKRLFGVSIMFASIPLAVTALIPNLVVTIILVIIIGACAGVAYVTGYTVIGLEVDDDTRGRTFAFLQSAIRVILFAVIAIAPVLAGAFNALIGSGGAVNLRIGGLYYGNIGYNLVLLLAAIVALLLGRACLQADGRPQGRTADARPGRGVPGGGAQSDAGIQRCHRSRAGPAAAAPACSWPWRAARARASRRRPGCWPSGCGTRATTWSPPTSRARRRSACGCARCCSTPRTPAWRPGPRRSCTPRTGPSTSRR